MFFESEGGRLLRRFTRGTGTRSRIEVEGCRPSRASMTSKKGVDHKFVGVKVGQFGSSLKAKGPKLGFLCPPPCRYCHVHIGTST